MDVNNAIKESIDKEKEFCAHINLFKLLLTTELSGCDYDYFCLMGGFNRLKKLEKDIKDYNINLFEVDENGNIERKELFKFYKTMAELKEELSKVTHTKNITLNSALRDFDMVTNYYNHERFRARNATLGEKVINTDVITWLENSLPKELVGRIQKLDGNNQNDNYVKKIGERK